MKYTEQKQIHIFYLKVIYWHLLKFDVKMNQINAHKCHPIKISLTSFEVANIKRYRPCFFFLLFFAKDATKIYGNFAH